MKVSRWKGHDELVTAWMREVSLDEQIDSTEKLVALTLGVLVCGKYRATHYPLQADIAKASCLSTRTVKRAMLTLEEAGHIGRRALGLGQGWRRTIYRLRAKGQLVANVRSITRS